MTVITGANHDSTSSLADLLSAAPHKHSTEEFLQRALAAVRTHLGLQVAYISEFEGNDAVFRVVDAPGLVSARAPARCAWRWTMPGPAKAGCNRSCASSPTSSS